jgi:hypothetical protein
MLRTIYLKVITFLLLLYVINIISYFIIWRSWIRDGFYELQPNLEKNGVSNEQIMIHLQEMDNSIFNIGFHLALLTTYFIPNILLSLLIVYFIFKKRKKTPQNIDVIE